MFKAAINWQSASRAAAITVGLIQFVLQAALQVLWSDEAIILLSEIIFYPSVAAALLLMAGSIGPANAVKRCKCYCMKQLARVRDLLSRTRRWLVPANVVLGMLRILYL